MSLHTAKDSSSDQGLSVLFITPWYPTSENPVNGIFVREHAKAVQLYDEVTVLHFVGHSPSLKQRLSVEKIDDPLLSEGIRTYTFQYRRASTRITAHLMRAWSFFRTFRYLRKQGIHPDMIHANVHSVGLPAILLGYLFRIPVVISEHHSAFPRKLLSKRQVKEAQFAFRRASRVLPVSRALQQGIEENGVRARFTIVPNVVDVNLFHYRPMLSQKEANQVSFICVATMPSSDVKGISYLLKALAQLDQETTYDWHIKFVGDGDARQTYEEQALELNLMKKVTFLGRKSKAEVASLMQEADAFVLPSVWDNMPCVIVEALASGLPIVATHVGGIPEMVDESSGILVPPKDVDALYHALIQMIKEYKTYDRAQISLIAEKQYSQDAVGKLIHSIYRECIDESIH